MTESNEQTAEEYLEESVQKVIDIDKNTPYIEDRSAILRNIISVTKVIDLQSKQIVELQEYYQIVAAEEEDFRLDMRHEELKIARRILNDLYTSIALNYLKPF